MTNTVDATEINNFTRLADSWWDTQGPYKILHQLNPVRLQYIKTQVCEHFQRDSLDPQAFSGLRFLDIGCGGGLVSIPCSNMGAQLTGLDACPTTIAAAQQQAKTLGSTAEFSCQSAEEWQLKYPRTYDVILALEILEHTANPKAFIQACCELAKPSGIIIFSTLTRTALSFILGIVGAEYIARVVPRGTHQWQKFLYPAEVSDILAALGWQAHDIQGLNFNIWHQKWEVEIGRILCNYFITAKI